MDKSKLLKLLKSFKEDGLTANQYTLELMSDGQVTSEEWAEFLNEPDIKKYIKKQMEIVREANINRMVQSSADSRSVGQSNLINALSKLNQETDNSKDPIFIYCYVPLTKDQEKAPNVLDYDMTDKIDYVDAETGKIVFRKD